MGRELRRKTTMGGCGLTYAAAVIALTCTIHAVHTRPHDPFIAQVTDQLNHHLLGTPTGHPFTAFIQEHDKQYYTREEYLHRLGVFSKNLLRAAEHQLLDPTTVHGVTPFSDLSEEEFEMMYLGGGGGWVAGGGGVRGWSAISSLSLTICSCASIVRHGYAE
ncbi:hypothetical protein L1987_05716 [Smallanthus sonchifolius]|uniref:Uncharacterized protein n=1 Tax=Smallanthus sonchifolius TaxID=185202 RepID=A0ACB9JW50_9ASTR|nr:hypothetical protein L1987_05716 [Smallanthus sonchifolius]